MPELSGISHIDLTVTDIDRSERFYTEVLGFEVVARERRPDREMVVMRRRGLANGVCLNRHLRGDRSPFDERRSGLDHLSFRVESREELENWRRLFDALGVPSSPIVEIPQGAVLVFRDPDNIQLELIAAAA